MGGCAKNIKSPKALPVALCVESQCGGSLTAALKKGPLATGGMPDCSSTACPSKCQCAEQKCSQQITDCLNDASCAAGQECIEKCACGDTACLLGCAKSIKSPKALPVALCVESQCGGVSLATALGRGSLATGGMPDCSSTA